MRAVSATPLRGNGKTDSSRFLTAGPDPSRPMSLLHVILVSAGIAALPAQASASVKLGTGARVPQKNIGSVDLTSLPLGDNKISSSAERGSIWLCGRDRRPANQGTLPWVHGSTWNLKAKVAVAGSIGWPDAEFSTCSPTASGCCAATTCRSATRRACSRSRPRTRPRLPADPMSITAQDLSLDLPANPTVTAQPQCMGMEVGVTLDGVELFNGFDAVYADAVAQEVQDRCDGHPNMAGYHRHWIPTCFKDAGGGQSKLMGFALDGFGIYGHRGPKGKVMTNDDLDACHGTTSVVRFNGKKRRMYHYVATWEFPYTVGCFRGTPAVRGPAFYQDSAERRCAPWR